MDEPTSDSFFAELKRRKVGRVAIAYVGVALGVLEVADIAFAVLFLDDRLKGVIVIAAAAGLPVVLVLAWLYDLTLKGVERTPEVESPDGLSARFTRQLVVTGVVVILAMSAVGWRYMPNDRTSLAPDQITVLPFENLTGDPGLESFGIIAANHLVDGLGQVAAFKTVSFNPRVGDQARRADPEGTLEEVVGKYTNSALVISGSYSREGDDLLFRVTVHDAEKGEVAFSAEQVRVDQSEPMADLGRMNDGVLGYFGMLGDRSTENAVVQERRLASRRAPSYAAYKEFALGLRAWSAGDMRGAVTQFELAASVDSTFFNALWRASTARINMGDWAGVERLVERMESMQSELTEINLGGLDWTRGLVDGDLRKTHDAAVRGAELIPVSPLVYLAGIATSPLNRPKEAIEHFRKYDLKWGGGFPWIWTTFAGAHHRLGRHRTELRLIRRGREALPDHPDVLAAELSALAALGRGEQVEQRIGELGPYNLVLGVAEEVEAHGDHRTAQRLLAGLLNDLDGLSPDEQQLYGRPFLRAQALAALDRDDEARASFEVLLEAAPEDPRYRSWSAILAARAGNREYAEGEIDWLGTLDVPYQRGGNVLEQARITAALGDAERAVRFLEAAFEQGAAAFRGLHVDPAYRTIRDHPAFQAYMEPKG